MKEKNKLVNWSAIGGKKESGFQREKKGGEKREKKRNSPLRLSLFIVVETKLTILTRTVLHVVVLAHGAVNALV